MLEPERDGERDGGERLSDRDLDSERVLDRVRVRDLDLDLDADLELEGDLLRSLE